VLTLAGRLVNSYGYALVVVVLCMDSVAAVNCHLNVGVVIDKNGK
jgi:mannose/fructose/N-acetylgalactosamine-specific phosphotransferase system component IIC